MKQPAAAASSCDDDDARRRAERAATFKRKHAEVFAEAAGVAAEFGADVCICTVARDGSRGSTDKFPAGRPRHRQAAAAATTTTIRQLVGKGVAGMGLEEAKAHEARLIQLRAAVAGKLQETETDWAAADSRPNKIIRLE
jgi:hypothetical protein